MISNHKVKLAQRERGREREKAMARGEKQERREVICERK